MQRSRKLIGSCAVLCLLAQSAIAAHSLIPENTNFQINGKVTLGATKHENCKITMVGMTSPQGTQRVAAKINSVIVNSKTAQCETLSFTNFPYDVVINSHSGGKIENLGFLIKGSSCGFPSIPMTISKKGLWNFNYVENCDFFGSLLSNPTVTIDK